MFAVCTPKNVPISVGTALPRSAVRNTCTATRVGFPAASLGKVTSADVTDTAAPPTLLASAVLTAPRTAGPVDERSVQLLNARPAAPASAPASAAFCACDREFMNM